jgi:hypothetical protein
MPFAWPSSRASATCFAIAIVSSTGLALEAGEAIGILRQLGRQHLDRHVAPELHVGRAVYLPQAARAEGPCGRPECRWAGAMGCPATSTVGRHEADRRLVTDGGDAADGS